MAALPGGVFPIPRYRAVDTTGIPIDSAKLYFWEPGGSFSTPKSVYTTAALTVAHANPVVANSAGLFAAMFFAPEGYDVQLKSSDGATTYWTALDIEDIAGTFLSQLGTYQAGGRRDLTSGATILETDLFVTVDSGPTPDPCIVNLPPVADRTEQIAIQNIGTVDVDVTPNGSEIINWQAGGVVFTIPAGTSPNWPTAVLLPSADDNGYILVAGAYLT